ncbi:MAG: hypothetical protein IJX14_07545 [Clostridia bacterium]|nr:hypothetical protein [Clostridia bacterium]
MLTENKEKSLREQGVVGDDILLRKEVLTPKNIALLQDFSCGNPAIDAFFQEKAADSIREVTYIFVDTERNCAAAAISLSCSAIPVMEGDRYYDAVPAVEITYFAVEERYQKMMQTHDREDGYFSDYILCDIISTIYTFTEEVCGASHVLLYAVPDAVHFYKRNFFTEIDESFMLVKNKQYLEGCIPMLLAL